MDVGIVNAPEIKSTFGYIDPNHHFSIKDFRGKIVLLDFWTMGCINCLHNLPGIQELQAQFRKELVVVGIHSGKFSEEKKNQAIRKVVQQYGITYPVVNDADCAIWQAYGIRAWPTLVVVDPEGKITGQRSGEGFLELVREHISLLIKKHQNSLDLEPFPYTSLEEDVSKALKFPTKLCAGADHSLFISDTGHHCVRQIDEQGNLLLTIGSGKAGLTDGKLSEACFNQPQGLCLDGHTLFVADTGNHAIRKVNLLTRSVTTVTGKGEMGRYFFDKAWGEPVLPNSPWDLAIMPDNLYIANAGNHQLLKLSINSGDAFRFAGSGREALIDGVLKKGAFNQPSGLAISKGKLYVADAEASAIREVDLVNERINTLVGQGLFVFGDVDGPLSQARLQHCMDICIYEKHLLVADTYNGKIKLLNLENQTITTILEGFHHPQGVCSDGKWIWVSDTYAHQLYRFDPQYPSGKPQKVSIF